MSFSTHVTRALQSVQLARSTVHTPAVLPQLGSDASGQRWKSEKHGVSKQQLASSCAAIIASCASAVSLTTVRTEHAPVNLTALGSALTTVSSNLPEFAGSISMLAALANNNVECINAGGAMIDELETLITCFKDSPDGRADPARVRAAATEVAARATLTLNVVSASDVSARNMDALMTMAKNVAVSTADLVEKAKTVAGRCDDPTLQQHVIAAAKMVALATSQLGTNAKVVAPCINATACQEQLNDSARQVAAAVERLLGIAQTACSDEAAISALGKAASSVSNDLGSLLNSVGDLGSGDGASTQYERACASVLETSEAMKNSTSAAEMVSQAKVLAQAAAVIVSELKAKASQQSDPLKREEKLKQARLLAEATGTLVEAAKKAAKHPKDAAARKALVAAAMSLRSVVGEAAGGAVAQTSIRDLVKTSKQTASAINQLVSASSAAQGLNSSRASQDQLAAQASSIKGSLTKLVVSLKQLQAKPDNVNAQLTVLSHARDILMPSQRLVATAKSAAPTVEEPAAAMQLTSCARSLGACLADLKTTVGRATDALESMEIESASISVQQVEQQVIEAEAQAKKSMLFIPNSTSGSAVQAADVASTTRFVAATVTQLTSAIEQCDQSYANNCARTLASAAQDLADVTCHYAATLGVSSDQQAVLGASKSVMTLAAQLLRESKAALASGGMSSLLANAAANMSGALDGVLATLPGQRNVQAAMERVESNSRALAQQAAAVPGKGNYNALQQAFAVASSDFNLAAAEMAERSWRADPDTIKQLTEEFGSTHEQLLATGASLAAACTDSKDKDALLKRLQALSATAQALLSAGWSWPLACSSRLLSLMSDVFALMCVCVCTHSCFHRAAGTTSTDPSNVNARSALTSAVRGITEAINGLLDTCTSAGPGQKECDKAIRSIQAAMTSLSDASEPFDTSNYFECLDTVMAQSKVGILVVCGQFC